MAGIPTLSSSTQSQGSTSNNYRFPLASMCVLFFFIGFITVLNDVLIPHLKEMFSLNYTQAMLIQFCFFSAYFVVSVPAGFLVHKVGYKRSVIVGLLTTALGCVLFYPAASLHLYWFFLLALFVLASGLTILQVSINPYVVALGPERMASSRLNLAQALNSLGTTIGPFFAGMMLLSAAGIAAGASAVKLQYLMLASVLIIAAIIVKTLKLPEINQSSKPLEGNDGRSIWQAKQTLFGAVAIFFYVGAEVGIGSFLINYFELQHIGNMPAASAAHFVGYYWGGAMIGRFIGSVVTRVVKPQFALMFNGSMAILLLCISMNTSGHVAMWSILAVGLFNSIMFPTIFSLAIKGLDTHTSRGSGLLCLAIVGGAIMPLVQGGIADLMDVQASFIIPALSYLVIIAFAINASRLTECWRQLEFKS
ncbi:sugar MFS transporter [Shewanella surugensis]|uniref:Sugar MFS transporter n=1 Tax=Shewanella surugensis TaxID=212020 RepID=A0ABT0LE26_9GAMM|nr:sugar MFS transporter [Shewanella surugensis]MCL1125948.1 sugar MFS transporter [Shewanella surugensis]